MVLLCFKLVLATVLFVYVRGHVSQEVLELIKDLRQEVLEGKAAIAQQSAQITELQQTVERQNSKLLHQEQGYKSLASSVDSLKWISNITQKESVHNTRKRLVLDDGPVAFHAAISKHADITHIGVDQKILFPEVLLNLGGGYHSQHGIFTAPAPGVYMFSTSVMASKSAPSEIWVHLVKNGHILANSFAAGDGSHQDQGSITVTSHLSVGDEVWVSLYGPADDALWGNYFTSFTGCLVQMI